MMTLRHQKAFQGMPVLYRKYVVRFAGSYLSKYMRIFQELKKNGGISDPYWKFFTPFLSSCPAILNSYSGFFNYSHVFRTCFQGFQHSFKKMWKTGKTEMNNLKNRKGKYGKLTYKNLTNYEKTCKAAELRNLKNTRLLYVKLSVYPPLF